MARSVRLLRSGTSAVVRGGRCIRRQAAERLVLRPCGGGTGLVCGGAGAEGFRRPPPCCPGGVGLFRCAPLPSSEFDDGTRFAHRDGDFASHVKRHVGVFMPGGQAEDDRDSQRPHVLRNDVVRVGDAENVFVRSCRKNARTRMAFAFGELSAPGELLHHAVEAVHVFTDLLDEEHRGGVEVGFLGCAERRADDRQVCRPCEASAGRARAVERVRVGVDTLPQSQQCTTQRFSETIASAVSSLPKRNLPGMVAWRLSTPSRPSARWSIVTSLNPTTHLGCSRRRLRSMSGSRTEP